MSTLRTDPANPIFNSTQTPLSLTVGCYNLAGASITLERFQQVVTAITELPQPPSINALSEFKPTGEPADTFGAITRLASAGRYHLVESPGAPTDGIAMLISSDLSHSGPPSIDVVLPHRVIVFRCRIFPAIEIPRWPLWQFTVPSDARIVQFWNEPSPHFCERMRLFSEI